MGQKDLSEKNLEYFPDVFADTVNALLYEGEPVLEPDLLKPAPTETLYYSQSGNLRNQLNDVSMYQTRDGTIHMQYTLENKTKATRKMLFRHIGYEGAVYREQWDRKETHPFIGLILYWGRRKWRPPRSVAEFFHNREIPLDTWKYINNFHMHVFEMARLPKEIRARFKSDMRLVVDYLAEGVHYTPTSQPIRHKEAFLLMMTNLTGDDHFEKEIPQVLADYYDVNDEYDEAEGEEFTMISLFDKYWDEGFSKGVSQGAILGTAQALAKNVETLMQNLSMSLQEACASINTTIEEYRNAKEKTLQNESPEVHIPTPRD